ncbi:DUF421 domain-containing protein [Jannaschia sp. M317]|uniref:DUF421 domain-containing protein n=1 Tax=Jannaschia sp. M317 TaxID=2867011 RepID=UPI0021A888BF|nr:YetF domain-containing protein [Jannaschia sp. M317]UWQ19340.1 DUF421 domain-containing protein [Jannaschia sp. M317]
MPDWSTPFLDAVLLVPLMVVCVRLSGLRAFSKMSSYDFAVTVSFGSVLAGTVLDPAIVWWQGAAAMAALFAVQWGIGWARVHVAGMQDVTDNVPLLLMRDGQILSANLRKARVTEAEVRAKLREANALDLSQVRAVVLETTGDVSVLHGDHLADTLLDGTRD